MYIYIKTCSVNKLIYIYNPGRTVQTVCKKMFDSSKREFKQSYGTWFGITITMILHKTYVLLFRNKNTIQYHSVLESFGC